MRKTTKFGAFALALTVPFTAIADENTEKKHTAPFRARVVHIDDPTTGGAFEVTPENRTSSTTTKTTSISGDIQVNDETAKTLLLGNTSDFSENMNKAKASVKNVISSSKVDHVEVARSTFGGGAFTSMYIEPTGPFSFLRGGTLLHGYGVYGSKDINEFKYYGLRDYNSAGSELAGIFKKFTEGVGSIGFTYNQVKTGEAAETNAESYARYVTKWKQREADKNTFNVQGGSSNNTLEGSKSYSGGSTSSSLSEGSETNIDNTVEGSTATANNGGNKTEINSPVKVITPVKVETHQHTQTCIHNQVNTNVNGGKKHGGKKHHDRKDDGHTSSIDLNKAAAYVSVHTGTNIALKLG